MKAIDTLAASFVNLLFRLKTKKIQLAVIGSTVIGRFTL